MKTPTCKTTLVLPRPVAMELGTLARKLNVSKSAVLNMAVITFLGRMSYLTRNPDRIASTWTKKRLEALFQKALAS
jgi:hypothetical protein